MQRRYLAVRCEPCPWRCALRIVIACASGLVSDFEGLQLAAFDQAI
jgi:hypothetical protein